MVVGQKGTGKGTGLSNGYSDQRRHSLYIERLLYRRAEKSPGFCYGTGAKRRFVVPPEVRIETREERSIQELRGSAFPGCSELFASRTVPASQDTYTGRYPDHPDTRIERPV